MTGQGAGLLTLIGSCAATQAGIGPSKGSPSAFGSSPASQPPWVVPPLVVSCDLPTAQSSGVSRGSSGRGDRSRGRPSTSTDVRGPSDWTRRKIFPLVCSIKIFDRDGEGKIAQRLFKDCRLGSVAVEGNRCDDNRWVLILQCRGGKPDQVDEASDAFKRPLEGREPAELNSEMVSTFNAEGPHVQSPSMEVDGEAIWEERSAVTGSTEPLHVGELDKVATGNQTPRLPVPIPMWPQLVKTDNEPSGKVAPSSIIATTACRSRLYDALKAGLNPTQASYDDNSNTGAKIGEWREEGSGESEASWLYPLEDKRPRFGCLCWVMR